MQNNQYITTTAGVKVPFLIYGTAWKKERTADLVEQAVLAGFRGIDTACQPKHYNEFLVGEALDRVRAQGVDRENLYLQTKFTPIDGQDPERIPYDENAPLEVQVAQSFEVSLKNLRTEYVDTLILHSPLATHDLTMKAWRAMEEIHEAGGVRQLGISNCYYIDVVKKLYADARVKPAILQNRFYGDTGYDVDLRRWCAEEGILYQSFWTLTANPHILDSETVQSLAGKYGKSEAQIFFRCLNQWGMVPLTGTCSGQHMREDLHILEFELSADELEKMGGLLNIK